jgi:hypothetical protein
MWYDDIGARSESTHYWFPSGKAAVSYGSRFFQNYETEAEQWRERLMHGWNKPRRCSTPERN